MPRLLSILMFLLLAGPNLMAQSGRMSQLVTLNYRNVRLGDALQNISTKYDVRFSYSKHYVPVERRINLRVKDVPLSAALDFLFQGTAVVYANIGNQIVLKKGREEIEEVAPDFGVIQPPMRAIDRQNEEEILTASNQPYGEIEELPVLKKYTFGLPEVLSQTPEEDIDTERYYVEAPEEPDLDNATAQISLYPTFGTNMESANDRTNNFSLNVLGGENGGVEGVEIGGLFNQVKNDVNGVQIAGLFNSVGGDVGPSRLIDGEKNKTFGVQVAGLINSAENARAVQVGGLLNVDRGDFRGVQVGGLGNLIGGDATGVQIGGLFNINRGDGQVQVAGLANVAADVVQGTQVSGLFNWAKDVEGVQFALINVCDTVSGASIGLISLVRRGYNQLELGGSETMYAQVGLRFGSRRFYNILQFGIQPKEQNAYGIGYGIGTSILKVNSKKWQWNTELVASQILEKNNGFKKINMIGQWRLTAEFRASSRFSIYLGPTANLMISNLRNTSTEPTTYGSSVPLYEILDNKNSLVNPTDLKFWLGFRAGIRFGRNY